MSRPFVKGVIHRWAFYSAERLAFGAIVRRVGRRSLLVQIIEACWHAESMSLPARIRLEERIRARIRTDLTESAGSEWAVTFRFAPRPAPEARVRDSFWTDGGVSVTRSLF